MRDRLIHYIHINAEKDDCGLIIMMLVVTETLLLNRT